MSAVEHQLSTHRQFLVRYACSLGASADDAQDLAQTTLLKALLHRKQFQGTCDLELRAWLVVILRNTNYSRCRKAINGPIYTDDYPESPVEPRQELSCEVAQVIARIEQLSTDHRESLCEWLDGAEYSEIANARGIALGTVKSRIFRARELLAAGQQTRTRPLATDA